MNTRKLFLPFLFLVTTFVLAACSGGKADIALETETLDLGDVSNGTIATRDVSVSNVGEGLLVVEAISTSCGCTTATLEPMQIAPGENGTLHIEYDAGAHGPDLTGPMVRQIFINSNDPDQPEVMVEMTVNVIPPMTSESN